MPFDLFHTTGGTSGVGTASSSGVYLLVEFVLLDL